LSFLTSISWFTKGSLRSDLALVFLLKPSFSIKPAFFYAYRLLTDYGLSWQGCSNKRIGFFEGELTAATLRLIRNVNIFFQFLVV